ncbi:MAG: HPr family phosphocarrier protein [Gammaproteobacteria bacterium]|nr:HPr family phosphocarrier protein [Gammaproteobacteria bacterium]
MIIQDITIINKLGLHARAASKLVNLCSQFSSSVDLENKGHKVNAKSIMGVMMLAASNGSVLKLEVDGEDEAQCIEAINTLFNNRFDEDK